MSETDIIEVGEPLPRIQFVRAGSGHAIDLVWREGPRVGRRETVDLAPDVFTYKAYRPLRDDPRLFQSVHLTADGNALAWGDDDSIDMPATAVERLAEEAMTQSDFAAFLQRTGLSFDAAAAQLGVSRRLVAYYAARREIPRYIALACKYLERNLA